MSDTVTTSVARLRGVGLRYRKTVALDGIDLDIPPGCMVGLIGPDGVGKSSLLSLIAGARAVQTGTVTVLDGDIGDTRHRDRVCPHIAYMPQGLGKNLYPSLSVEENLQFFGRLFGHGPAERRRRIDELCTATGLQSFLDRPAGKLSGGMKQKLGLCCALIHDPDLLILDEPTTGVDPLSRNQFWDLITRIRQARPGMSVVVATAYMEEAERFDWLVAMNAGRVLATGTPAELHAQTGTNTLEAAFIALLPETVRQGHREVIVPPLEVGDDEIVAIEARDLTMRFGNFTAVDHASFRIRRGEIFGFLGSNGCGKSTTMKMLTGLLDASDGEAWLFGQAVDSSDIGTRRRVGYMSQAFSLYSELTVRQNLVLHARLYHVPAEQIPARVDEMVERFDLASVLDKLPDALPLGIRQRLSLAVAMVHKPELLILDEPTSGVDPIARDAFWRLMIDLARNDKVTIFISTHFMNEATRCDRISLMHAGEVLVTDEPAELVRQRGSASLEAAFISYLEEAVGERHAPDAAAPVLAAETSAPDEGGGRRRGFSLMRVLSYSSREALELQRDPVRATLALVGSLILMFIMGYGISMDVDNLTFAVLDHDRSGTSRDYVLNLAGSRYFIERDPIRDHADMDRRMRNGELSLAIEIPPNFGRDLRRGDQVQIASWVDGSMPARAETASGYVQGMHQTWLAQMVRAELGVTPTPSVEVEIRYRYNPDVESLQAMVPAVIPMLLMMIPAMLTALSVVREKELGSIINLYVTPVSRLEFLLGKQVPYIVLGMLNFLLLTLAAVTIFGVPLKGSFLLLAICSLAYIAFATGFGLFASTFTDSQLAAIFATMIGSMIPVVQFSGIITPVSSLEGVGRHIGEFYPATYMVMVSRGVFSKALGFADLGFAVYPIMASVPVILVAATLLLRKQAR